MKTREELVAGYDRLALEYAAHYCDELDREPFDRSLLRRFAETGPDGTVCDLGCGPGHIAAYLDELGTPVIGVDLSPHMVAEARRRYPNIDFQVGDMLDLPFETASVAGIVAFYSIIHLKPAELGGAFREMYRVLRPGGLVAVKFHKGQGDVSMEDVWGTGVTFSCTLFEPEQVLSAVEQALLRTLETTVRWTYEGEDSTQSAYVLAEKPPTQEPRAEGSAQAE